MVDQSKQNVLRNCSDKNEKGLDCTTMLDFCLVKQQSIPIAKVHVFFFEPQVRKMRAKANKIILISVELSIFGLSKLNLGVILNVK